MKAQGSDAGWDAEAAQAIIDAHAGREGPGLPILHAVQHHFGHIPAELVPMMALSLNLTRAEVHGLISFYHDFRREPAGRAVLRLCRAEACKSMGADALAGQVQARLGIGWHQTTPDGRITLEPVFCLGLCAAAPAGMLDASPAARLSEARIGRMLEGVR